MQLLAAEGQMRRFQFGSTAMAHMAFVPTGIVTVMLGPLLPLLAAKWSLNDTQSGFFISAQFAGALAGTAASSFLLPRIGFGRSIALGQLLMAIGVGSLISGGFRLAIVAICCYGIGIGVTIPAGNLTVAETARERRSSSVGLLNVSWGVGAMACAVLLAFCQKMQGTELFLRSVAGLFLMLAVIALTFSSNARRAREPASRTFRPWAREFRNSAAIMIGALFFIYVGTENALGAWLASFAKRASDSPALAWMTVTSYFYGALVVGRILTSLALRDVTDAKQACGGALLTLFSSAALVLSRSAFAIALCAFVAGLGFSTLYPITISLLSSRFGERAKSMGGFMFALSTLGGASVPWLVGFVSTRFQSLRSGLVIPFAGSLLMLAIFTQLWSGDPRNSSYQFTCQQR
jgi:fucose permease